jgi:hypothetical protein
MNYMEWAKDMVDNKKAQELIERKIEALVTIYFDEKDVYAIEKMIKSFGESIKFQEILALRKRGLHPDQLQDNLIEISMNPEATAKKFNEIEGILISEIERQYRHFTTFLSAVRSRSPQKQEA